MLSLFVSLGTVIIKNIIDAYSNENKYKKELRTLVKNIIADDYIYLDEGDGKARDGKEKIIDYKECVLDEMTA